MSFIKSLLVVLSATLLFSTNSFAGGGDNDPWPWNVPCDIKLDDMKGVWKYESTVGKKKYETYFEFMVIRYTTRSVAAHRKAVKRKAKTYLYAYQLSPVGDLLASGRVQIDGFKKKPEEKLTLTMHYTWSAYANLPKGYDMKLASFAEPVDGLETMSREEACSPDQDKVTAVKRTIFGTYAKDSRAVQLTKISN